jgi:hypothetical protein
MQPSRESNREVDDRRTTQPEAVQIIRNLRDRGFDSSNEELGLALGRPAEEIAAWYEGTEPVDDDVVMKARRLSELRGIRAE